MSLALGLLLLVLALHFLGAGDLGFSATTRGSDRWASELSLSMRMMLMMMIERESVDFLLQHQDLDK